MMKNILTTLLLCLSSIVSSQTHYTIEGSINKELDGEKAYLYMVEEDNRLADSTVITNGKFHFEGELFQPCWAAVKVMTTKVETAFVVLESGITRLHIDKENFQCEGTPTNEAFMKSWQAYKKLNEEILEKRKSIDNADIEKEKKKEQYLKFKSESQELCKTLIKEHVSKNTHNIMPAFWIRNFHQLFSQDETNEILANASPVLKQNHFIQNITQIQSGNHFIDIEIENQKGEKLKLSDVLGKGNYVLVDIWASWCGGCIKKLPQVKAIGEKYASKGLKLLNISIDRDKNDWKKALNRLQLPWEQLHADYTFVNAYGINSIPVLMLVSPNGTIIKSNLQIEEADKLLETLRL